MSTARRIAGRLGGVLRSRGAPRTNTSYWTGHNVTLHRRFGSRAESVDYLAWRNSQYLFYDEFIPFDDLDDLVVIDFGCGPGHDLVAITERSRPARLVGLDISRSSLDEARVRLGFHGVDDPELLLLREDDAAIPLPDGSVDFFLSSGVLHHCPNIDEILGELHRVLRPGGRGRVMVYNRDSIWVHLYVPYTLQQTRRGRRILGVDPSQSPTEAFRRSTDGPNCPYSVAYGPDEFIALADHCGFEASWLGAAVSVHEMRLLPDRLDALQREGLDTEHRKFLADLSFDRHGRPLHEGRVAGIDGFFELRRRE